MTTPSKLTHPASSWNVNAAMRDIYDIGEKIQLFPIILGEVAKQIHDEPDSLFDLKVESIEWMIPLKNHTPEVASLFNTWGFARTEKGYGYTFEGIPVSVRLIKNKYKFFERPDMHYYKVDEFMLPNPFAAYWRVRNLIK